MTDGLDSVKVVSEFGKSCFISVVVIKALLQGFKEE